MFLKSRTRIFGVSGCISVLLFLDLQPVSLRKIALANRRQYLFKIAIPMLGPIFKTACTMSMIGSLKYFDMSWNMTQGGPAGGPELLATYMYKLSFQQWKMGYGSAVAAGMFILITAIALLFQKIFVVKEDF